jgi:hypothetical protein
VIDRRQPVHLRQKVVVGAGVLLVLRLQDLERQLPLEALLFGVEPEADGVRAHLAAEPVAGDVDVDGKVAQGAEVGAAGHTWILSLSATVEAG